MNYTTLYNRARTGAVRVWEIAVEGNAVHTRFGQLDGKMQEVTDYGTAKHAGRSNEVSAEQDAQNMMDRLISKKMRKGYDTKLEETADYSPFEHGIVDNLSFYKPQNSLNKKMEKMVEDGKAWAVRKYDGEMMVIVKNSEGEAIFFSRRMLTNHHLEDQHTWRERFDHIATEIEENDEIPNNTILLGEIVNGPDADDRWRVAKVMKSLTPKALEIQEKTGFLHFICWDVAWAAGLQLLGEMQYRFRLDHADLFSGQFVHPPETFIEGDYKGVEGLRNTLVAQGWEGFVIVDPHSTYGEKSFNLRGKPDRPNTCCKLKPVFELDAVCLWDPEQGVGKYGRGKNRGKVGSVALHQYDADGELVYLCDCGGGLTQDHRNWLSTPGVFPVVAEIQFASRTFIADGEATNALQFPRVVRFRDDKEAEECIEESLTYGSKSER
jgi:ATP-dependent DNA ligase/predicted DNA-binding WGR domain protein